MTWELLVLPFPFAVSTPWQSPTIVSDCCLRRKTWQIVVYWFCWFICCHSNQHWYWCWSGWTAAVLTGFVVLLCDWWSLMISMHFMLYFIDFCSYDKTKHSFSRTPCQLYFMLSPPFHKVRSLNITCKYKIFIISDMSTLKRVAANMSIWLRKEKEELIAKENFVLAVRCR